MLEKFLLQLSQELDFEQPLPEEAEGIFTFPIDDRDITMTELTPGVVFYVNVGPCPKLRREELFERMMHGNLFGQGTGGAVVALDETGEKVTLSLALPWNLEYREFRDALEDFLNWVDFWTDEIQEYTTEAKGAFL